jgi:hypothetical protein
VVSDDRVAAHQLGDTEIQHLHEVGIVGVIAQEDVLRLDVAVNHALLVRRAQRRRHLAKDAHRGRLVEGARALQARGQRLAFEQLHHDAVVVRELPEVGDLDDVGVADVVHEPCFGEEARDRLLVLGDVRVQDLDRRLAADQRMAGQVDLPHPTFPEQGGDHVGADRLTDQLTPRPLGIGHRHIRYFVKLARN